VLYSLVCRIYYVFVFSAVGNDGSEQKRNKILLLKHTVSDDSKLSHSSEIYLTDSIEGSIWLKVMQ